VRSYVTVLEYTAFLDPDPVPANAERLLNRASTTIDKLLIGAVYQVDDGGLPVDADLLAVIKDCVCLQAQYVSALGDETGAMKNVASMSMGNQSISRGFSVTTDGTPRVCPDVLDLLQVNGLHPISPLLWG
jgi:hypothetical protein